MSRLTRSVGSDFSGVWRSTKITFGQIIPPDAQDDQSLGGSRADFDLDAAEILDCLGTVIDMGQRLPVEALS